MTMLSSLNKKQKEAIGLLQVGTFLEYFDLMLYVHMAVLMNELFFPKTDPKTASLLAAFAFCSTYVLRPFGAMIFGYIGDNIGRKATVVITTMMMALSCIVMANLPTYAQVGITAAWMVTICRIIQGMSSMGEIMGALIYITEIIKRPLQYQMVSLISLSASIGTMFALAVATLVTRAGLNWRMAFWVGACIAVIGSVARTRLRETPEFLQAKENKKKRQEKFIKEETTKNNQSSKTSKNLMAYFAVECSYALTFYLTFIHLSRILKTMGYTANDIIFHNFWLSLVAILYNIITIYLSTKYHPLKILKTRGLYGIGLFLLVPVLLSHVSSLWHLFAIQFLLLIYRGGATPADSIFIEHFKVQKRFTLITFNYALSRAFMHIISALGLVYLTDWFGHYGLWIIGVPISIGFVFAVRHFQVLEAQAPISPRCNHEKTAA